MSTPAEKHRSNNQKDMSAGNNQVTGPDLTLGVPVSKLENGQMLVGHVNGESVLVARHGDEVFAVGATCTHYSGPLGEGLLVGDTIRCPWHHACFSLRTGEALRPPALNPLSCWRVEHRDGHIFVTEKVEGTDSSPREAPSVEARVDSGGVASVVIIGAGAAGNVCAETLRKEGYEGGIMLVGAEDTVPYDRPNLSKDYLAGTAPEEWIPLRSEDFYRENGIELLSGSKATSLDVASRRVQLEGGASIPFDRLLLATGAEPVRLALPGSDLPHVHYLRSLADSRAIIANAANARQAMVLGASFIGLEVAAALRTRGLAVHVVAPDSRPMERILGAELGDFIRTLHEEHGVVFHLNQTATAIAPHTVTLSGGDVLPADLVVVGVGVRPRVALAENGGLDVDHGVVVDEYLETSVPGVFAAGDIARWPDPRSGRRIRVEHWVVAERQGQVAARNILGRRERFDAVPFFWSQHYDVPITYVGHAPEWDQIDVAGSIRDRDCMLAYRSGDRTLAVAAIYRDQECLQAEVALEQGDEDMLDRLCPRQGAGRSFARSSTVESSAT